MCKQTSNETSTPVAMDHGTLSVCVQRPRYVRSQLLIGCTMCPTYCLAACARAAWEHSLSFSGNRAVGTLSLSVSLSRTLTSLVSLTPQQPGKPSTLPTRNVQSDSSSSPWKPLPPPTHHHQGEGGGVERPVQRTPGVVVVVSLSRGLGAPCGGTWRGSPGCRRRRWTRRRPWRRARG